MRKITSQLIQCNLHQRPPILMQLHDSFNVHDSRRIWIGVRVRICTSKYVHRPQSTTRLHQDKHCHLKAGCSLKIFFSMSVFEHAYYPIKLCNERSIDLSGIITFNTINKLFVSIDFRIRADIPVSLVAEMYLKYTLAMKKLYTYIIMYCNTMRSLRVRQESEIF